MSRYNPDIQTILEEEHATGRLAALFYNEALKVRQWVRDGCPEDEEESPFLVGVLEKHINANTPGELLVIIAEDLVGDLVQDSQWTERLAEIGDFRGLSAAMRGILETVVAP